MIIVMGVLLGSGFSPELDSLRLIRRDVRRFLAELEAGERERTGIKSLKIGYNRVFGYYIEVSKANASLVPERPACNGVTAGMLGSVATGKFPDEVSPAT